MSKNIYLQKELKVLKKPEALGKDRIKNQKQIKMTQIEDEKKTKIYDIEPNNFNAYKQLIIEDSNKVQSNINKSDLTSIINFDIDFLQTKATTNLQEDRIDLQEDRIDMFGRGGKVKIKFGSSNEAQIKIDILDFLDNKTYGSRKLKINFDNVSKFISIITKQLLKFKISSITVKNLPLGYEIVGGVSDEQGNWTIERGYEEDNKINNLQKKDGFLVTEDGIEIVLKYNSNIVNKDFFITIEAHSTFDLSNYKLDSSNYKSLTIPKIVELVVEKEIRVQLKDIRDTTEYIYDGKNDIGLVLSSIKNKNIITYDNSYDRDSLIRNTILRNDRIYSKDRDNNFYDSKSNYVIDDGNDSDILTNIENAISLQENDIIKGNKLKESSEANSIYSENDNNKIYEEDFNGKLYEFEDSYYNDILKSNDNIVTSLDESYILYGRSDDNTLKKSSGLNDTTIYNKEIIRADLSQNKVTIGNENKINILKEIDNIISSMQSDIIISNDSDNIIV